MKALRIATAVLALAAFQARAEDAPKDWGTTSWLTSPWLFVGCQAADFATTAWAVRHYGAQEVNPAVPFPYGQMVSHGGLSLYVVFNLDGWHASPTGAKLAANTISCLPPLLNLNTVRELHNR